MADEQLRRSQLIDYENIAGHDGMQTSKSGSLIIKPCQQAEIDFYQSALQHPKFRHFIPLFMGILELNQIAEPKVSHSRAPSQNTLALNPEIANTTHWTPSGGGKISAQHGIVLENVAHIFKKPNILDVKLGRRLWADDAPSAKRLKLDKIASETTSQPLGFRIAGMKTFVGSASLNADNIDGYRKYDKHYGRTFTSQTVRRAFEEFFFIESAGITKEIGSRVIRRCIDDLRALQGAIEAEESRMYSSSLLFVVEGDIESLLYDLDAPTPAETPGTSIDYSDDYTVDLEHFFNEYIGQFQLIQTNQESVTAGQAWSEGHAAGPQIFSEGIPISRDDTTSDESSETDDGYRVQAIKMIDFAHAAWTPGQGPDENVLFGIRNVIKILEEMIS